MVNTATVEVNSSPLSITGAGVGSNFGYGVYLSPTSFINVLSTGGGSITITASTTGNVVPFYGAFTSTGYTHTIGGSTDLGPITIIANGVNLDNDCGPGLSTLNIQTAGTVTVRQNTNGTPINLGGADVVGSPPTLGLSDTEINNIHASTIDIGDANSGILTLSNTFAGLPNDTAFNFHGNQVFFNYGPTAAVLSSSPVFTASDGSVHVLGTSGNDNIYVAASRTTAGAVIPNSVTVTLNTTGTWGPYATNGKPVTVFGYAGDDTITVDPAFTGPTNLFGGDGNDTLTGGGGNDYIDGGAGTNYAVPSAGNDTIVNASGVVVHGDPGNNAISFSWHPALTLPATSSWSRSTAVRTRWTTPPPITPPI